jgi:hypothetical protein
VHFLPAQKLSLVLGRTGRLNGIDDVPYRDSERVCIVQSCGEDSVDLEHGAGSKWSSISTPFLQKLGFHLLHMARGKFFQWDWPQLGYKVAIDITFVTLQRALGNTESRTIPKP